MRRTAIWDTENEGTVKKIEVETEKFIVDEVGSVIFGGGSRAHNLQHAGRSKNNSFSEEILTVVLIRTTSCF